MSKYYGLIGFAVDVEIKQNTWAKQIIERPYKGDLIRNIFRSSSSGTINDELAINNSISIIADSYLNENIGRMVYVTFGGSKWKISSIDINRPRLLLYFGSVYNE